MAIARRAFFRTLGVAAGSLLLAGHTPYRQWAVYRRKHLLLLTHRDDPEGVELARKIAEHLAKAVPSSQARITRAPQLHRVASLLATDQLQFAFVTRLEAKQLRYGRPPLEAYGRVPVTAIATVDEHVLLARSDVPDQHAWLLAQGLDGLSVIGRSVHLPAARSDAANLEGMPVHPGVTVYSRGGKMPSHPVHTSDPSAD